MSVRPRVSLRLDLPALRRLYERVDGCGGWVLSATDGALENATNQDRLIHRVDVVWH